MKYFIFVLFTVSLLACQTADRKPGTLTQSEKDQAVKDSSNFTTIQWIDSTVKNLGKVKSGTVVEVSYRFRNTGDKPLIISDVHASCGCTVPEKPEKPISPGAEDVIRAKFDSHNRKGQARKDVFVTANTKPLTAMRLSFEVEVTD